MFINNLVDSSYLGCKIFFTKGPKNTKHANKVLILEVFFLKIYQSLEDFFKFKYVEIFLGEKLI